MKDLVKFIECYTGKKLKKWQITALKAVFESTQHKKNKQLKNHKTLENNELKGLGCDFLYIEEME